MPSSEPPATGAPRESDSQAWYRPAQPKDPAEARLARELTAELFPLDSPAAYAPSRSDPPPAPAPTARFGELFAQCEALEPVALASQYVFGLSHYQTLWAVIAPAHLWRETGKLPNASAPLASALPTGAFDLTRQGYWAGFNLHEPEQALDLAKELLARGFDWSPDLQLFCDQAFSRTSLSSALAPLAEARALQEAVPPARAPKSARRM